MGVCGFGRTPQKRRPVTDVGGASQFENEVDADRNEQKEERGRTGCDKVMEGVGLKGGGSPLHKS